MDNVCFEFGPNQTYLFNAPSFWARRNLPKPLNDLFTEGVISEVLCATFGDDIDNYFFLYETKASSKFGQTTRAAWGDNTPSEFRKWLLDDAQEKMVRSPAVRVVLGPGESFVAWDVDAIRWSDVPKGLESALQSWLTPSGWDSGPPRLIALGHGGAFFALSEFGAYQWSMPSTASWSTGSKFFQTIEDSEDYSWTKIKYISMSASRPDTWVVVFHNTWVNGGPIEDYMMEHFQKTADAFASSDIKEFYEKERADSEKERLQAEAEAKKKKAAEEAQRRKAEEAAAELQLMYVMWVSAYEAAFASNKPLKSFPTIPTQACVCSELSCLARKRDSGLAACRHDIEALLRASGKYSTTWLKTERNPWHPDRFGNKCDPSFRDILKRQSQEIFTIYSELIDAAA